MGYLKTLFKYEWELVKSLAGVYQWLAKDEEDMVVDGMRVLNINYKQSKDGVFTKREDYAMFALPFKNDKKQCTAVKNLDTELKIIEFKGIKWIDIIRPTSKEIQMLKDMYGFHDLLIEDCMTEHQRSKVDSYDDYSFIVLHLPRYKKEFFRLDSEEIDSFIGRDYLVKLYEGELKPLVELA